MPYLPNKYQMSLEWTLAICVRNPNPYGISTVPAYRHVQDLDATLTLGFWPEDEGFGWELDEATIGGLDVNAETDRELWQIVKRAVDFHDAAIDERVQEYASQMEAA